VQIFDEACLNFKAQFQPTPLPGTPIINLPLIFTKTCETDEKKFPHYNITHSHMKMIDDLIRCNKVVFNCLQKQNIVSFFRVKQFIFIFIYWNRIMFPDEHTRVS